MAPLATRGALISRHTMNTAENLKEEFGTRFPLLNDVAKKYLNWGPAHTAAQVYEGKVPFEYFKLTKSRKSPILVDVIKLAKYIDEINK